MKILEIPRKLSVNKTQPDTETASNWDDISFEFNKKSKCYKEPLFWAFLQNIFSKNMLDSAQNTM